MEIVQIPKETPSSIDHILRIYVPGAALEAREKGLLGHSLFPWAMGQLRSGV